MTEKEAGEIKHIARFHRWALEELTVDQKMQEANRLLSATSSNEMFQYLRGQFGSAKSVLIQARYLIMEQRERRKTLNMDGVISGRNVEKTGSARRRP